MQDNLKAADENRTIVIDAAAIVHDMSNPIYESSARVDVYRLPLSASSLAIGGREQGCSQHSFYSQSTRAVRMTSVGLHRCLAEQRLQPPGQSALLCHTQRHQSVGQWCATAARIQHTLLPETGAIAHRPSE